MQWDVNVDSDGLEIDDFDIPEAVYFLAYNADNRLVGSWRITPTTAPTMIDKVWPEFLKSIDIPSKENIWEASRFSVDSDQIDSYAGLAEVNKVTKEMFYALTKVCMLCGIEEIYTMYDDRIGRLIKRINCSPYKKSAPLMIDGRKCEVGAFRTNQEMLSNISESLKHSPQEFSLRDIPPNLLDVYTSTYGRSTAAAI